MRTLSALLGVTWTATATTDDERLVVCTGGEPPLQLDEAAIEALHARGFRVAVETNGTVAAPASLDWICMSPKAGTDLVVTSGDELKLVFPQEGLAPVDVEHLAFDHLLLQPMDGPDRAANTAAAIGFDREGGRRSCADGTMACLSHRRRLTAIHANRLRHRFAAGVQPSIGSENADRIS